MTQWLCLFCKSIAGVESQIPLNVWWVFCPVCGTYGISHTTLDDYALQNTESQAATDYEKAVEIFPTNPNVIRKNILSENKIIWKSQSDTALLDLSLLQISVEILEDFSLKKMPLVHDQKPAHLLKLINDKAQTKSFPFEEVSVALKDVYRLGVCGGEELWRWVEFLQDRGLIVEVAHVKEWAEVSASSEALTRSSVQNSIQEACAECGFKAEVVDATPHNDKICEKIIGLINHGLLLPILPVKNKEYITRRDLQKGKGRKSCTQFMMMMAKISTLIIVNTIKFVGKP